MARGQSSGLRAAGSAGDALLPGGNKIGGRRPSSHTITSMTVIPGSPATARPKSRGSLIPRRGETSSNRHRDVPGS